jgi:hypothetical protein
MPWPSLEVRDGDDVHSVAMLQKHDGVGEAPEEHAPNCKGRPDVRHWNAAVDSALNTLQRFIDLGQECSA